MVPTLQLITRFLLLFGAFLPLEKVDIPKKPRVLCLHGSQLSAEILRKQVHVWPEVILDKLDLVFLNGPYAVEKSVFEGVYDPPFYEWFQSSKDHKEIYHFEECLDYLEDFMVKHGPFDGLLGFSQGAVLSAAVPGMQSEGVALTKVPLIKFLILISGSKLGGSVFGAPELASRAFSSKIKLPSIHIIGDRDNVFRELGEELVDSFEDPLVIRHPGGHIVPTFDEKSVEKILDFIGKRLLYQLKSANVLVSA